MVSMTPTSSGRKNVMDQSAAKEGDALNNSFAANDALIRQLKNTSNRLKYAVFERNDANCSKDNSKVPPFLNPI